MVGDRVFPRTFVAVLMMAAMLVPVASGAAPAAATADGDTISASVRLDSYNGPPAVGFEVRLVDPASSPLLWDDIKDLPATTTDSQGRYSLDGLRSDRRYVVVVSDPAGDYATRRFYFLGGPDLEADREVMAWGVPASGSVKDDEGQTVGGALVTAGAITYTADSNGAFAIPAVGPNFSTGTTVDISASSPDGLYARAGQRFTIAKATPAVFSLTLPKIPVVSGRVVDGDDNPVADAYVQSAAYNGSGPGDTQLGATTDQNGYYQFEYYEGSNNFSVRVNGEWEGVLVNGVDNPELLVEGQATVDFVVKQRGQLSGRVKTPEGDGLRGAVVEIWRHDSAYDFCDRFCYNSPFETLTVDENGDWSFGAAPAVEYSIIVRQALSNTSIPDRFMLGAEESRSGLDATTTDTFLEGKVLDTSGKPLSGVGVIAAPESSFRGDDPFGMGGWYHSDADDEGQFKVAVTAGEFLLQAGYGGENRILDKGAGANYFPGLEVHELYDGPKSTNNVIQVTAGETVDGLVDRYDLRDAIPTPPAALTFPGIELSSEGVPVLRDDAPLPVLANGCANATARVAASALKIFSQDTGYDTIWRDVGTLTETPAGSGTYSGNIDFTSIFAEVSPDLLRVELRCDGTPKQEFVSGLLFPDRAGVVVDENNDPIGGASVQLYRNGEPISSNPIVLSRFSIDSDQTTASDGLFDWETSNYAQDFKKTGMTARVSASGCTVPGSSTETVAMSGDLATFQTVKLDCSTPTGPTPPPAAQSAGYWMLERSGILHGFGAAATFSAMASGDVVDFDRTNSGDGLWVLDETGKVQVRGAATHYGDVNLSLLATGEQLASISGTSSDKGYWVFTDQGRVLTFGDAVHYDDLPGLGIKPVGLIVASAPTASGLGYYMLGADGGVFAFGDATFAGSIPQVLPAGSLACSIVGLVPVPAGGGYWMVGCDGGVFSFGSAEFRGSIPGVLPEGTDLNSPINGLVPYGNGYLMVAADGGVFTFSDREFLGSLGDNPPGSPIIAISAFAS